ncbi:MAG: hypothetical protein ABI442_11610, partial [Gemmatimonadaceae bacterium]
MRERSVFRRGALAFAPLLVAGRLVAGAQTITAAGGSAQLDLRAAGAGAIRVTLSPLANVRDLPFSPAVAERAY